ncbi:MAG TPA: flagellar filament capping protein FliD [Anaeromyxobacter sp.]|nr:flagellar filament capping protein FliD [Anaeromyxobacter sp.]
MATFRAGGLATGMDTNSIIDQLVDLQSLPIKKLQTRQANLKVQVSALGDLISKLNALDAAAADLGSAGVFATKATSSNVNFASAPGSGAAPGRWSVEVERLATAARWRSAGFAAGTTFTAGTLSLTVQGKTYPPADAPPESAITIKATDTLADVAYKIRKSGAPVSAAALTDATGLTYLSITSIATGQPLDGGTDLALTFTPTGAGGSAVDAGATLTPGANASVWVDGLNFVRTSNAVSDVIPGVTLTLTKQAPGAPEDLVVATDDAGTKARLQKFVDAYNGVMALVQRQLNVGKDTDRERTLAGDGAVRDLQTKLQKLVVQKVDGSARIRTLADLGMKTARDGSLSIDATTLHKALASDPAAVDAVFGTAGTGLAAAVKELVDRETRSVAVNGRSEVGLLVADQNGLNRTISELDKQAQRLQLRVDAFRENLVKQFTAMENTVSGLKGLGTYINNQFTQWSNSGSK